MTDDLRIEARAPSVDEFRRIVAAVDWHELAAHDDEVLRRSLDAALFTVCAVDGDECIGCVRVIGDGGLHFYVEEVAVVPAWQGRGAGRRLMQAVVDWLADAAPPGAAVELLTGRDRADFYGRFGFKWQGAGVMRWRPDGGGEPASRAGSRAGGEHGAPAGVRGGDRSEAPGPTRGAPPEAAPLPGPGVEVVLVDRVPTPAEERRLFEAVGWYGELPDDDEELAAALDRSLFAVCAVADGAVVGCARVVGDGAVYLYVQDVIVLPAWQGTGLGDRLMQAVMGWLDACCPPNAFVALFAAPDRDGFYRRYGFELRPLDEPGMAQQWRGPGSWQRE